MKKWISAAVGLAVVTVTAGIVVSVAGPIVYRTVIASPSSASASTTVPTIIDGSAESIANTKNLAGQWGLTGDSWAGYRVDVTEGDDVDTVNGQTAAVSGSMTMSGTTLTAAEVTVDTDGLTSGNQTRDTYITGVVLDCDRYPTAHFTLTAPVVSTASPVAGQVQLLEAQGTLTLHGVSRAVTMQLQATISSTGTEVEGSIPVTFADYGVPSPDLGFVSVAKTGMIEFALVATKQ